ncbi:hypothetical protein SODALDRAFT_362494 [Sodiomyces alkalinus F11]|uniref:Uncharacterized protein n=1 Tax=Sodiomyces alkalinus (strain CBS 110278 / VKM F-3762 / F11) TaxID=1314773 RepID=A0A3N2PJX7_SODAK|nr:hypothetical protein SODALDRAFT_363525 [Sodiomyces alkalinus F11]XP_028464476.1 hypothetical protein SODALDRAFT_362494 [Sodiomyces alkalinus F11]ROT34838.1 hypothetical protein SODALDRAFT_363525 [Sodiomyces alkalinus F11]ROT36670.1 hypothetical protein SODALDRAFT_362494 [Sodiomyces alkalinus F11]
MTPWKTSHLVIPYKPVSGLPSIICIAIIRYRYRRDIGIVFGLINTANPVTLKLVWRTKWIALRSPRGSVWRGPVARTPDNPVKGHGYGIKPTLLGLRLLRHSGQQGPAVTQSR